MKRLWLVLVVSGTICGAYDNFRGAYDAGNREFKAHQYSSALKCFQQAAKKATSSGQIYSAKNRVADTAIALKNYALAEKFVNELLDTTGLQPEQVGFCHRQLGLIDFKQKKYPQAIRHFQDACESCNNCWCHYSCLMMISSSYYQQRNYAQAEKYARKLIQLNKSYVIDAWVRCFECRFARKDLSEAQKVLAEMEKHLKKYPDVVGYLRWLQLNSNYTFSQRDFSHCAQWCQKIINNSQPLKFESYLIGAQNRLMTCYIELKDFKRAKAVLDQAKAPCPRLKKKINLQYENQEYFRLYKAAHVLFQKRDYSKAMEMFQDAAEAAHDPNLAYNAWNYFVYSALRTKKLEAAKTAGDEIRALQGMSIGNQAAAYRLLAEIALQSGDCEGVIKNCRKSINLQQTSWVYYWSVLNLSDRYIHLKKYDLAERYLLKVIKDPRASFDNVFKALRQLALMNIKRHNLREVDECMDYCDRLANRKDAPQNLASLAALLKAECWFGLKKYARANQLYQQVIVAPTSTADDIKKAQQQLVLGLCRLKKYDEAKKVLKKFPNAPEWLKKVVKRDAESQDYNLCMKQGMLYMNKLKYFSAFNIFMEAADNAKNSVQVCQAKFGAAWAAQQLKNLAQAHDILNEVLEIEDLPTSYKADCLQKLGYNSIRQHSKRESAIKYFQDSIALYPHGNSYYSALIGLGQIYVDRKNYHFAEQFYARILADPKVSLNWKYEAQVSIMLCKAKMKDDKGVVEYMQKINQLTRQFDSPSNQKYHRNRTKQQSAHAWRIIGKHSRAAEMYAELYRDPNVAPAVREEAANMEAYCYLLMKRYKKAKRLMDEVKNPQIWLRKEINKAYLRDKKR